MDNNGLVTVYKTKLKQTTAIVIQHIYIPLISDFIMFSFWLASDIVQLNLSGNPGKTAFST